MEQESHNCAPFAKEISPQNIKHKHKRCNTPEIYHSTMELWLGAIPTIGFSRLQSAWDMQNTWVFAKTTKKSSFAWGAFLLQGDVYELNTVALNLLDNVHDVMDLVFFHGTIDMKSENIKIYEDN